MWTNNASHTMSSQGMIVWRRPICFLRPLHTCSHGMSTVTVLFAENVQSSSICLNTAFLCTKTLLSVQLCNMTGHFTSSKQLWFSQGLLEQVTMEQSTAQTCWIHREGNSSSSYNFQNIQSIQYIRWRIAKGQHLTVEVMIVLGDSYAHFRFR